MEIGQLGLQTQGRKDGWIDGQTNIRRVGRTGDLVEGGEEVLGRPDPEHAEVGEDHQVEQGQLQEVREAGESTSKMQFPPQTSYRSTIPRPNQAARWS